MTKKQRAIIITEKLEELYPNAECSLNYSNPVELLIATQLSAQCTDARVNIVTEKLFKKYRSTEDFANADYDELCEDIRSTGFYRNKAKNLIACCKRLLEVYNGEVPDNMEDLLTLPGTGRKTANLILGDIFGKPAIVVDTHCIRLSNRMGLTTNSDPVKIESDLRKLIPPDKSSDFCHRLVLHGRAVCPARKPDCKNCTLSDVCKKVGVNI